MANKNTDTKASKMAKLNNVIKGINKKFGENTIVMASQKDLSKRTLKTPSIELNNALYGGFSGIVELFGDNQAGKTSLALDTIALHQKEDPEFIAAWMETEDSITEDILKQHHIDFDRFIFWKQEDVEKGNAESSLDVARAFLADGSIDMLVVNSIAGLSPSKELEDDLEKQNIALTARILSKFFRVAIGFISKNDIVTVFINQIRDDVGKLWGDPSTTTGGRALSFYADQRIRMSNISIGKDDPITKAEGVKINNKVKKNRRAGIHCPYTECTYYALFDKGIDSVVAMPALLKENNIFTVKGAHWYYYDNNNNIITIDGIEGHFSSKNELINVLRENKAWYDEMMHRLDGEGPKQQSQEEIDESVKEQEELENDFSKFLEEESNNE